MFNIFTAFKKIAVYRLNRDIPLVAEEVERALSSFPFSPCGSQDIAKTGWVSPFGERSEALVMTGGDFMLLCARKEDKNLPSAVIKRELNAKVEKLEAEQSRKLKKTEKDSLKDEVLHSLLPRAFTRINHSYMVIDTKNGRIYVSETARKAEDMLALLRKSLGSLPVVPLTLETPVELTMTGWVRDGEMPAGFSLGDSAQLKAILEDGGVINCKKQDLISDEISTHIAAGKVVTKLALDWQERIQFAIDDNALLSGLRFSDSLVEQNDDIDREDVAQRLDADFLLMTGELTALMDETITALGGEVKRA